VSYRDDREALRAEKASLEAELSEAREEIQRLRVGAAPPTGVPTNAWLGGPARVQIDREVEVDADETVLEEVVAYLRSHFGTAGRIERLGSTLSWTSFTDARSGRNLTVHFTRRGSGTRVRIEESLRGVAGGLFGGIVGGVGGSGFANLAVWSVISANVLLAIGAVGWLSLVYFIVRAAYASWSQRRVDDLGRLADQIEERVKDAGAGRKAPRKKARVADETSEEESEQEEEREQEEEEARGVRARRGS
jgi:hypothetical protein